MLQNNQIPVNRNFAEKKSFTYFDYLNTYSKTPKFTAPDYNAFVEKYNQSSHVKLENFDFGKKNPKK